MAEERIKSRIAQLRQQIEELQAQMEPHHLALKAIETEIKARSVLVFEFEKVLSPSDSEKPSTPA